MRALPLTAVFSFLVATNLSACVGTTGSALEPTYSSIQRNVFDVHCAVSNCHRGPAPESHLNLEDGKAYRSLVNVQSVGMAGVYRVRPGRPDSSYLLNKLAGERIVGDQMPLAATPLPDSVIAVVRTWIQRGARPE